MSDVSVTVTDDGSSPSGEPPDQQAVLEHQAEPGMTAEAKEAAELDAELRGLVKGQQDAMIADAKGGTADDKEPETADDPKPDQQAPGDKPDREPPEEDPPEPAPTLSKARRRMALARKREAEADHLVSQARAKMEQIEQLTQKHASIVQTYVKDPLEGIRLLAEAAGRTEDEDVAAIIEHRLQHGTGAERAKVPPANSTEQKLEQVLKELAELKKAREEDQTAATQQQQQLWLQQDVAACQGQLAAAPKDTPYLAAVPEAERADALQRVLTQLHKGAAELKARPDDPQLSWVRHFMSADKDDTGKVLRTPVQKMLEFLDKQEKERYTKRHEQLSQLLPAAPADASGSNGATSAGGSPPVAPGAKDGRKRKLGGANVAANAGARSQMTDEQEAARVDAYLRGEIDAI